MFAEFLLPVWSHILITRGDILGEGPMCLVVLQLLGNATY